jgi:pimeloyl-ACP methyl ester carboxylesterase
VADPPWMKPVAGARGPGYCNRAVGTEVDISLVRASPVASWTRGAWMTPTGARGKFHLVGVAGGGFAALDYAAWRPERLRSLVVAASTGQFSEPEMREFSARLEIPDLRKLPAVYREVGPSYRAGNPEGTKRWIEIEAHAQQPGAPSQPLRTPNTFAKLAALTMPTLVMAADADLLAPPALMRAWAAHLKDYEWTTVPDSGHAIAWEQPEIFNEMVLAFIKRH